MIDHGASLARLFPCAPTGPVEDYRIVFDALECARVVGVLDAWAERNSCDPFRTEPYNAGALWICRSAYCPIRFEGPTADAARAAAAKAIESGEVEP